MHIRINIPAWGFEEYGRSLCSFLPIGRGCYLNQLKKELQTFAEKHYIYLLSSGRFGIFAAVKQLGLTHPRVAVPGYVCPSVIDAICYAGAEPVFIDVEPNSIRFDRDILKDAIRQGQIDAIVATNTYGFDQDFSYLTDCGLPIIEDAAYQAGYKLNGSDTACGLRCSTGIWSFNFKALTSVGGGVLFSREPVGVLENLSHPYLNRTLVGRYVNYLIRSVLRTSIPQKMPGARPPVRYEPREIRPSLPHLSQTGMSNLQAAIAYTQWLNREKLFKRQLQNAEILRGVVSRTPVFSFLKGYEKGAIVHLYPILLNIETAHAADAVLQIRQFLYRRSIQTEIPYPVGHIKPETHPNVYDLVSKIILVPCNASLSKKQMDYIAETLSEAGSEIRRKYWD